MTSARSGRGAAPAQWWAGPELARVWSVIAARLERSGLVPVGRVRIANLTPEERRAVSDLVGRTVTGPVVQIDLAALDRRLRERADVDLVTCASLTRGELVDRPAHRAVRAAHREAAFAAYEMWAIRHPEVTWPWAGPWLEDLRRRGILGREPEPARLVTAALDVLWSRRGYLLDGADGWSGDQTGTLTVDADPVARTELAARVAGDAHALDDDRRLAAVVLRALAVRDSGAAHSISGSLGGSGAAGARAEGAWAGGAWAVGSGAGGAGDDGVVDGPQSRRALWERLGVLTDSVSSTCLTFGLRSREARGEAGGDGGDGHGHRAGDGGGAGAGAEPRVGPESGVGPEPRDRPGLRVGHPLHVTWWDLRAGLVFAPDQDVLVCENPRVLEALAEAGVSSTAVVAANGRPALVVLEVLTRLVHAGARLRYHGDFDWPGITMANDMVRRFGATPWQMSADDYLGQPATLSLSGAPVEPVWDGELGAAMRHRGFAVHEESMLPGLVERLRA